MSVNGIGRLQSIQMQASVEKQGSAREKVETSIEQHQQHVDESYEQALIEVEHNREARETKGLFGLLGTILLGPIIGTLIGDAIGGWANDGDEAAAREAKKNTGLADLQVDKAYDRFEEAKKGLEESQSQQKDLQKFSRELRDSHWVGTV